MVSVPGASVMVKFIVDCRAGSSRAFQKGDQKYGLGLADVMKMHPECSSAMMNPPKLQSFWCSLGG